MYANIVIRILYFNNRVLWQHDKILNAVGEHDQSLHHEIQSEINSESNSNNYSLPLPLCDLDLNTISNPPPIINRPFLASLESFVDTCIESIFGDLLDKKEERNKPVRNKNFTNGYIDSVKSIGIHKTLLTPEVSFVTTLVDGIFKDIFTDYNETISTNTRNQDIQRGNATKSINSDSSSNSNNELTNPSLNSSSPKDGYSFIAGQAVRLN